MFCSCEKTSILIASLGEVVTIKCRLRTNARNGGTQIIRIRSDGQNFNLLES